MQESTVLYGVQGLKPWAQEGFSCEESFSKGAVVWNSSECPFLVYLRVVSMESISATLSWLSVRGAKRWRMVNLFCPVGLSAMYKEYSNDLISQQPYFQRSFQMPTERQFLLGWHNFHLIFFILKKNCAQLAVSFSCLSESKYHKLEAQQCFYFY